MSTARTAVAEGPTALQAQEETRKIDEQVQLLKAQIRVLHAQRNRFTLISKLPTEIIAAIFSIVRDLPTPISESKPSKARAMLVVSWVCQDWRGISVATPDLWSVIDIKNEEFVQMSLERSLSLPLSFKLSGLRRDTPLLSLISQSLSRAKALDLSASHCLVFRSDWARPTPLLEELVLDGIAFPEGLFAGTTPRLRTLSVSHYPLNRQILPISVNLTFLRLVDSYMHARDILSLLQLLPNLKELELSGAFRGVIPAPRNNTDSNPAFSSLPSIHHPRLRRLYLDGSFDALITLLYKLTTSPSSYITISNLRISINPATHISQYSQLIAALGPFRSREKTLPVSLKIEFTPVTATLEVLEEGDQAPTSGFRITIINLDAAGVEQSCIIFLEFSSSSLESLEINGTGICIPDILAKVFDLHNLRSLKIYPTAWTFIKIFVDKSKEILNRSADQGNANNTTDRSIHRGCLQALEYLELELDWGESAEQDLDLLRIALIIRKARLGRLLKELVIILQYSTTSEDIESFEGLVEQVEYREPVLVEEI